MERNYLAIRTQDLKELLKEKFPDKYKRLKKTNELNSWANDELELLNEQFNSLLKGNPDLNTSEAREIVLADYTS